MTWALEQVRASASDIHAWDVPDRAGRLVRVCEVIRPALVLGSTQPDDALDRDACRDLGLDVVRRRSGGGAVLVVPGDVVWVDVVVPAADPLWDADVTRSFFWLGSTWSAALADLGVDASVHRGALVSSPWSRQVCFAGVGPGEVLGAGGAKMIGIAQRRTRAGARFQCAALLAWHPAPLVRMLGLGPEGHAALAGVATAIPGPPPPEALVAAFLGNLPA